MSDEADPEFSFQLAPTRPVKDADGKIRATSEETVCDIFEVRKRAFKVRNAEEALALFRELGPWRLNEELDAIAPGIRLSAVLHRKEFFENVLLRSTDNMNRTYTAQGGDIEEGLENIYLWQPLPMELKFAEPVYASIRCKDIEDSLRASVFLERIDEFEWRRCKRVDCGVIFKREDKRQVYHDSACAHLQSVRDFNERKRLKALKKKRDSKKRKDGSK